MKDIEKAISMRPTEEKFKRQKFVVEEVIQTRIQTEKKMVEWVLLSALKRKEIVLKNNGGKINEGFISVKAEKTMEIKIMRKYNYICVFIIG